MAKGDKVTKGWVRGLYGMSDKLKDSLKRPFVEESIKSGFDSGIRSKRESLIDKRIELSEIREKIASGDVQQIRKLVEVKLAIEADEKVIQVLEEEKAAAFESDFEDRMEAQV